MRFQGALLDENPFKGPPSAKIDAEWERIMNRELTITLQKVANEGVVAQIRVDAKDLKALDKPETQAAYSKEIGGGYTAGLEVFHQIHCLNMLRQWSYKEYYLDPENAEDMPAPFKDSNHTLRLHLGKMSRCTFYHCC